MQPIPLSATARQLHELKLRESIIVPPSEHSYMPPPGFRLVPENEGRLADRLARIENAICKPASACDSAATVVSYDQYLDNSTLNAIMPQGGEYFGMKQIKERVHVGNDENGKPIYKWATGFSRQDVLLSAGRILLEHGLLTAAPPPTSDTPLFREYALDWFENIRVPLVKKGRVDEGRGILTNYVLPFFGDKRIGDIRRRDIAAYFAQSSIQRLARSTADNHGELLGMIFRFALDDDLIEQNPVTDYKQYLPKRKTTREALSAEDTADIIAHMHLLQDEDRLLLSIFLFTGARRGEALGLMAKDIDLQTHMLTIEREVLFDNNRPIIDTPKTQTSVRKIPIMDGFPFDLVEQMQPNDFILGGSEPWTETTYRRAMERIGRRINLHGATAHVFRHTYATLAIASGIDVKTVQGLLGHSTASTTLNIYSHVSKDKILQSGTQLNKIYSYSVSAS